MEGDDEIDHWKQLIGVHTRQLRIQEMMAAKFGLYCPQHVLQDIEDRRREISELEQKIRRRNLHAADTETFYSSKEVDEIYNRISEIVRNQEEIIQLEAIKSKIEEDHPTKAMASSMKLTIISSSLFQLILVFVLPALGALAWYFFDRTRSFENLAWATIGPLLLALLFALVARIDLKSRASGYDYLQKINERIQQKQEQIETGERTLANIYKSPKKGGQ